jgi:hypothetical protein
MTAVVSQSTGSQFFKKCAEIIKAKFQDKAQIKRTATLFGIATTVGIGVTVFKKVKNEKPKKPIKGISIPLSAYLQQDPAWYEACRQLSSYAYLAPATFERLCWWAAELLYFQWQLVAGERAMTPGVLSHISDKIGAIIESVRVLRAHVSRKHGFLREVMEDFDTSASSIQTMCNDIQHNLTFEMQYQWMQK